MHESKGNGDAQFLDVGNALMEDAAGLLTSYLGRAASSSKGPFDLVTEADHAVEAMVAERLSRSFPSHEMIGEESGRKMPGVDSEYCWVLDPLDGTVNYAAGHPFFAVSLALFRQGVPVIGWVYDPVHNERFRAIQGGGATLNGIPIGPSATRSDVLPVGLSTGFIESALGGHGGILAEVVRRFGKIRILGSQALHLCYVAAGRLRAAASVEAKLWDDAAGALIVAESGRRYVGLSGNPVFPIAPDSSLWAGARVGSIAGDDVTVKELVSILGGSGAIAPADGEGQ
ncbi:inositol monophosphatase family protein (plasmid) [Tundrisphaera lichenicola]|uniref:inositol monophosphatase family protein n=1 Tax=Tundrisphaera lichenicola TaxID=2029860 RepID=UPI003EBC879B